LCGFSFGAAVSGERAKLPRLISKKNYVTRAKNAVCAKAIAGGSLVAFSVRTSQPAQSASSALPFPFSIWAAHAVVLVDKDCRDLQLP
jgi:hypothetical protein